MSWMFEKANQTTYYLPMILKGYYGWPLPTTLPGQKPFIASIENTARRPSAFGGFVRPQLYGANETGWIQKITGWTSTEKIMRQSSSVSLVLSKEWWMGWKHMQRHLDLPSPAQVYTPWSYSPRDLKKMRYGFSPVLFNNLEDQLCVSDYFNHQFQVNSLNLLSLLPSKKHRVWVSKFQIQLLWWMAKSQPLSMSDCLHHMYNWQIRDGVRFPLGSITSQVNIVEQLQNHGWLECLPQRDGRPLMRVSDMGRRVLSLLSPQTEDKMLPERIAQWKQDGFIQSKEYMDAYLMDFFHAQWAHMKQKGLLSS